MALALGTVKPGSTILIPFNTFDSNDPSASVIVSDFILGDIGIYKGTSMDERGSTTGVVLLDTDGINIDGATGIHGFTIDLSSNATDDFYTAGSRYYVTVGPITVDAGAVSFVAATFEIGYPGAILDGQIATLASQTSFTITNAPTDDSALVGCTVIIHDQASATQFAVGYVSAYTTAADTITLKADPGIFTMAAGDNVSFFMPANVQAVAGTTQTAGDLAALIVTADGVVDAIKLETDKLTLGDAGAGQAGSIIEEIENRPTTAMRGTDNVVLAGPTKAEMDTAHGLLSTTADLLDKLGAVDEAAAAGDPSSTESVMQYVKQLVNLLAGSAGIGTNPSAAVPGNAVNIFEILNSFQARLPDALVNSRMDSSLDGTGFEAAAVDLIWDEALSGHTTLATFGQVMNALGMITGAINDGGASTTAFIVDGFTEATENALEGGVIVFTSGALIGQSALIVGYAGASQTITVQTALIDTPANDDEFVIVPGAGVNAGTAGKFAKYFALLNTSGQLQAGTIGTNAFTAAKFDAGVGTEFANANWNKPRSENVTAGTFGDSFQTVVNGAAEAGTLSTTQMTTDLTEATDEHYNGRVVIWTSGVLKNQASDITAYLGSSGRLTYTATTEAPSATDTFIIY